MPDELKFLPPLKRKHILILVPAVIANKSHCTQFSVCLAYRLACLLFLQIMRNAAETLIPVTLELGGKDAFIVCEDVDVNHVWILLEFLFFFFLL